MNLKRVKLKVNKPLQKAKGLNIVKIQENMETDLNEGHEIMTMEADAEERNFFLLTNQTQKLSTILNRD